MDNIVYTTTTGDVLPLDEAEPCLGSQGVISTSACVRMTDCALCCL